MKTLSLKVITLITLISILGGCARDLSSTTYTSSSTLSLTLEGKLVAVRAVTIKDTDKMGDNAGGMLAGGVMGAALGSGIGSGSGNKMAIVGTAIVGGLAGAALQQKLGESKGFEYIIKLDTSKLKSNYYEGNTAMRNAISAATTSGMITVVQGNDTILSAGQSVYVIFSDNRTRVIAATY